ncbi:MAG: hypothetical protein V4714_01505, partial [Bacteroidota bacterium]
MESLALYFTVVSISPFFFKVVSFREITAESVLGRIWSAVAAGWVGSCGACAKLLKGRSPMNSHAKPRNKMCRDGFSLVKILTFLKSYFMTFHSHRLLYSPYQIFNSSHCNSAVVLNLPFI